MTDPITTVHQVTIAAPGSQVIALLLGGLLMAFSFQLIVTNVQVIGGLIALGIRFAMKLEAPEAGLAILPINPSSGEASPNREAGSDGSSPQAVAQRRRSRRRGRRFSIPGGGQAASKAAANGLSAEPSTSLSESPQNVSLDTSNSFSLIAGLGLMVGIILAISPASFFAVKLSRVDRPILGAISGLVLWSAYFLILTWLSSQALGSILQTLLGGALDGVQQLLGAIAQLFQPSPSVTEDTVKKEIQAALSSFDLDSRMQTYLSRLPPIQFDLEPVEAIMQSMLALPALQSFAGQQLLNTVDRDQLGQLLQQHVQLSDPETAQILDQLAPLWRIVCNQTGKRNTTAELVRLLKTTPVLETGRQGTGDRGQGTGNREGLSVEARTEGPDGSGRGADSSTRLGFDRGGDFSSLLFELLDQVEADLVLEHLLNQVDLSEWDVARLWQQFQQLCQGRTGKAVEPLAMVPKDVENYLLAAVPWELNPTVLAEDLPDIFYDPEADPSEMGRQLTLLNLDRFTQILNQRGDLAPEQVERLAAQLESLRQGAIAQADQALEEEQLNRLGQAFKAEVEALPLAEITPKQLSIHLESCLESLLEPLPPDAILALKAQLDPSTLTCWLQENTQLTPEVAPTIAIALDAWINTQAKQIELRQAEAQAAIDEIQAKLTAYLTYTALDKLTDTGMRHKLQTLVEDTAVDAIALYQILPELETDPLEKILSRRQALDAPRREDMISHLQVCWREQTPKSPEISTSQVFSQRLIDTLQAVLSPDNSAQDPSKPIQPLTLEDLKPHILGLIKDPNIELNTLAQELMRVDWSPLLTMLLTDRFDASQAPELLPWLQAQIYAASRLPRRWLSRLQDREQRFEKRIHRYLKHHAKDSFQPERMRRDLQKILQTEMKRAKFMDTTEQTVGGITQAVTPKPPELPGKDAISTTLADRDDLTPTEIEQISQALQTTWQEVAEQFKSAQQEAQTALDTLWAKLTIALKALQISPATLERIEQELNTLLAPLRRSIEHLSDSLNLGLPDSPLATLRSRIETWNQTAITQLIQTRDDLSETVNRYIQTQLDTVRREIDQELAALEREALKQLNHIRRTAATAATWLLAIALSSAVSSALAGFLAVQGLF